MTTKVIQGRASVPMAGALSDILEAETSNPIPFDAFVSVALTSSSNNVSAELYFDTEQAIESSVLHQTNQLPTDDDESIHCQILTAGTRIRLNATNVNATGARTIFYKITIEPMVTVLEDLAR